MWFGRSAGIGRGQSEEVSRWGGRSEEVSRWGHSRLVGGTPDRPRKDGLWALKKMVFMIGTVGTGYKGCSNGHGTGRFILVQL